MSKSATLWQHSNKYSADAACEHCEGIVRHEPWCITQSSVVLYAYEAVLDADKLTEGDRIILHALGVKWEGKSVPEVVSQQELIEDELGIYCCSTLPHVLNPDRQCALPNRSSFSAV